MDLRQLQAVVAVARYRNFTKAAEALLVAQPAISAQIRKLEKELGVRLFERTTRRVGLTDAGAILVARAERILAEVESASRELRRHSHTRRALIRIGAWFSVNPQLSDVLAEFLRQNVDIDVTIREARSVEMLDMLRSRDLDVAFTTVDAGFDLWELQYEVYLEEPLVLIVPPGSQLADGLTATLQQVADVPLIMHKSGSAIRRVIEHSFAAVGRSVRIVVETDETITARTLVARGVGAAIVPRSVARAPGPAVTELQLIPPPMRVSVVAWRAAADDVSVRKFIEHSLRGLAARTPQEPTRDWPTVGASSSGGGTSGPSASPPFGSGPAPAA